MKNDFIPKAGTWSLFAGTASTPSPSPFQQRMERTPQKNKLCVAPQTINSSNHQSHALRLPQHLRSVYNYLLSIEIMPFLPTTILFLCRKEKKPITFENLKYGVGFLTAQENTFAYLRKSCAPFSCHRKGRKQFPPS